MSESYNIIRMYEDGRKARVQKRGVSLKEARKWCNREDTSSSTHPKGKNGVSCEWFDGYKQI